jgi:predicted transcriptional regulator
VQKIEIRVEPIDAFWNRGRKTAALADEGKRIAHSRIVAFEDVADLLSVLTPQRTPIEDSKGQAGLNCRTGQEIKA